MMEFLIAHKLMIITVLFCLSEALALIPAVKANSVFQLMFGFLKKEHDQIEPKV